MAENNNFSSVAEVNKPPSSVEAEQALLGCLLLNPRCSDQISDRISADDFYREDHREIYTAFIDLIENKQSGDAVTVAEWFQSRDKLDLVAGGAYLTMLANNVASAANVVAYADIVREKSVLRQLIDVSTEIAGAAYRPDGRPAETLLEEAEQKIFKIAEQGSQRRSDYIRVNDLLKESYERIEELSNTTGDITGVSSGFVDLDQKTAGLQPSDLIIVAGRPAMGKTTFAMNIAENAAIRHQVGVGVFSMEMSAQQLVFRLFSSLGAINQKRLRTGKLEDTDWDGLNSAFRLLKTAPIFIDETPGLSPSQIRARARRMKREHDIGLIVIDYLQLMQVPNNSENRATEIAEISRGLKGLAKELNLPVIALSQLNRALEQRPNKRPVMADLRESGAIEQDADMILFIYRDEVYNEDSPSKGMAEVIIGKHRNGSTGTLELLFQGEFLRFQNYSHADDIYSNMP